MRAGALILIFALTAAVAELFSVELEYPLLNVSTESDNMKTSHSSQVLSTITQSDRRPLVRSFVFLNCITNNRSFHTKNNSYALLVSRWCHNCHVCLAAS
jgi:hypothetical protein